MNVEYALGKNGKIQEIISKEEFARRFPKEHFEINPNELFCPYILNLQWTDLERLRSKLKLLIEPCYKGWHKFGPYGDAVSLLVEPFGETVVIASIQRRVFQKPALAVDCVIFVHDEADNYFFVGIERSKEPGKGKAALVGGFIDVDGYDMETSFEAVKRELEEEVGLRILIRSFLGIKTCDSAFTPDNIPLLAQFSNNHECRTILRYLGDTETGDEEKLEHLGTKRVHRTFVYTCLLSFSGLQTVETVGRHFKAGSDAAKLVIIPFSPADPESVLAAEEQLAVSHHKKMFSKALAAIMQKTTTRKQR